MMLKRRAESSEVWGRNQGGGGGTAKRHRPDRSLQLLYEKTRNILFAGANTKNNNDVLESHKDLQMNRSYNSIDNGKNLKQLFINSNGSLYSNGIYTIPDVMNCNNCKSILTDKIACCSYCEYLQCSVCAEYCEICGLATCNRCSIISYGGKDGIFCLSCCR